MLDLQERRSFFRRLPKRWLVIGTALALVATGLAAKITINAGGKLEFGQGVFQVRACDTWIGVGLSSTNSVYQAGNPTSQGGGGGYSAIQNVIIYGLNPAACNNTNLRLAFYKTGNSNPLYLYQGAGASGAVNAQYLTLRVSSSIPPSGDTNLYDQVTLITPAGQVLSNYADSYFQIDPGLTNAGVWDGSFDITFNTPLCLVSDVNTVTLQSASA